MDDFSLYGTLDTISHTAIGGRLVRLVEIYRETDIACADFQAKSGHSCPSGCGTCCTRFVPDLSQVEVDFMALELVTKGREADLESRLAAFDGASCPLYDAGTPYHCSVYESRGLICRMFGFSGMRKIDGTASFTICKHMPRIESSGERSIPDAAGNSTTTVAPATIVAPIMSDQGMRILGINPDDMGTRDTLDKTILAGIRRIKTLLAFVAFEGGDDSNPDDRSPKGADTSGGRKAS